MTAADVDYSEPPHTATLRRVRRNEWEHVLRAYPVELLGGGSAGPGRTAKLVAWHLASYTNPDGTSGRPGERTLREQTGLKDRAVRKALDALRRAGLVRRVARGSNLGTKNSADRYELTCPPEVPVSTTTGTTVPVVDDQPPAPRCRTTGTTVPPTTTRPLQGNPPTPRADEAPARAVDNQTSRRVPRALARAWSARAVSPEDQQRLWLLLRQDPETRDAEARGKSAGWLSAALDSLRIEDKRQREEQGQRLRDTQPPCPHGTPAGLAPILAPGATQGQPRCPDCRRQGREAAGF